MLLAMHESREKETQLKNQLEAATLELERQNKEKDAHWNAMAKTPKRPTTKK